MALSRLLDLTDSFNNVATPSFVADLSEWDYAIVQVAQTGATVSVTATCDPAAITGVTDGNSISAKNFVAVQGTNLNSGSSVSTLTGTSMVRFTGVGKFLKIAGAGTAAYDGVFILLFKTY